MSNFDLKTLFVCVVLDIIDTISDLAEQGGETIGVGGGLVEAGFDTLDMIQFIAGLVTFYLLNTSKLMYMVSAVEPVYDEGFPIPLYTGAYLFSVFFMKGDRL